MNKILQTYKIKADVEEIWQALVDPKIIKKWGAGPAKMSEKIGFKFSLWGGDIIGKNIEVKKKKLLKQEWSQPDWEKPSLVKFVLTSTKNITTVKLTHTNFPIKEEKDLKNGWKDYYLGAIKELLENEG